MKELNNKNITKTIKKNKINGLMGNNSGNGIKPKANSKLNNIMKGGVITKCDNKLCKSTNFTIPCESKVADYCLNLCERCV